MIYDTSSNQPCRRDNDYKMVCFKVPQYSKDKHKMKKDPQKKKPPWNGQKENYWKLTNLLVRNSQQVESVFGYCFS